MNKLSSITPVVALLALSIAGATSVHAAESMHNTTAHTTKAKDAKCGEAKCGAAKKAAEAKCGAAK